MSTRDCSSRTHTLAAVVAVVVFAIVSITSALGWHHFPFPFAWLDVALVYFLSALPLAASLTTVFWRAGRVSPLRRTAAVALEVVSLLLLPFLYVQARTQNDIARSIELVRQSRYAEASQLVHRTLHLVPRAKWNGNPLRNIAAAIDETVDRVERSNSMALGTDATKEQRIERAKELAMLGDTSEALKTLDFSSALAADPEACNLRGTIYETQRRWGRARDWYDRGKTAWQPLPDSPARAAGLSRAVRGIAYCERKVGRLRAAEKAWQELLSLAPTAESHFFLAQFYEDTQQAEKSELHARLAMKLDPEQYAHSGQMLLNKLITSHFGCVGMIKTPTAMTR
jgi:tetratricopeptide (TPR) repeat protein